MLDREKSLLNKNINSQKIIGKTKFHTQILESWLKLIDTEPKDQDDIENQFIAHNQYIKINGTPISNRSLYKIKIKHLYESNGKIMEITRFNILMGITI